MLFRSAGHNWVGLAERKIKTVQDTFAKIDLKKTRLHATGLQTFCKLVENLCNNLPLGYSHGRDSQNNPLLRLITPNMLRVGRLNSRSLQGPIRYPNGPRDYLKKVDDTFNTFYKIWNVVHVPRLIPQPKWFKDSPELKPGDVVYFKKVDNELSNDWSLGQVDSVTRSRDGIVRRATVRYYNVGPNSGPKWTDRSIRSLVRLFSIDDTYFVEDMAAVERQMKELMENKDDSAQGADDDDTDEAQNDKDEDADDDDAKDSDKTNDDDARVEPIRLVKTKDGQYCVSGDALV